MNYNLTAYFLYGLFTIYTIVYVGKVLHKNGRYFVLEAIKDEAIGDFINNGLLVGYYLVNIGFVLLTINQWEVISTGIQLIEQLSIKSGSIFLLLGILHHCNILVLKTYSGFNRANAEIRK